MAANIESAYEDLVTLLRVGEFRTPEDGWSAEMIGAHVALNNDEIAGVAEGIARGVLTPYDNESGVDDAVLREFVERVGGRDGVASEVERSARRLAQAQRDLNPDAAALEIPVVIHDNGSVVVDRPVAVGDFIEGNTTFHLQLHVEQLRTLTSHDE